jgi:hypothetical protein
LTPTAFKTIKKYGSRGAGYTFDLISATKDDPNGESNLCVMNIDDQIACRSLVIVACLVGEGRFRQQIMLLD